jgi:hypothetical protein
MGIIENLREAQKDATGTAVSALATVLSLTPATIAGVVAVVEGKSFNDASDALMKHWAAIGYKVGREQSDEILRHLIEAIHKSMKEKA